MTLAPLSKRMLAGLIDVAALAALSEDGAGESGTDEST